ncbi:MAG: calcium/sodium antiporter [Clostridia bacterium]|nr:calcium/sodium antiporter [Clostridia bacterium]
MNYDLILNNTAATWVVNLILLVVGFVLLVKGADFFVDGSAGIAKKLKISTFIIGVTVVAVGTSAPELAVTIVDATAGTGDLIMGNILGSNALNVLLILGLSAVICKLPTEKTNRMIDMPFLIFVSALFLIFGIFVGPYAFGTTESGETFLSATMPWYCGLILLVLYIGFMAYNIVLAKKQSKAGLEHAAAVSVTDPCSGNAEADAEFNQSFIARLKAGYGKMLSKVWFLIVIAIIGLLMVVGGATLVVNAARTVSVDLIGIDPEIVALTVVAFGTSLPELITSVSAAKKGDVGIATGNIIGSNIANILLIGGMGALCSGTRGVPFTMEGLIGGVVSLVSAVLIFGFSTGSKTKSLGRIAGIVMLVCFICYYGFIFLNKYALNLYLPGLPS